MRKAEVLKNTPKEKNRSVKDTKGRESVYGGNGQRYLTLEATAAAFYDKSGRKILEIDLWDGKKLKARYFADGVAGSHYSYFPEEAKWAGYNINNTAGYVLGKNTSNGGYWYGRIGWNYYSEEDRETAQEYMKPYCGYYGSDNLLCWETELMAGRREKQAINKQRRIDTMMDNRVPDIPEGFDEWAKGIIPQHYVFQKKTENGVECFCTACGNTWEQKKGVGTKERECPKCGEYVRGTYKDEISTAGRNRRRSWKKMILMQPCRDNGVYPGKDGFPEIRQRWVMRFFWIDAYWSRLHEKYIRYTEGIRIFVNKGQSYGDCYYLKWIGPAGEETWSDTNPANWRYGSGYVYTGTLPEVMQLWSDSQRRSGIHILAEAGRCFDANNMIMYAATHPAWEYLSKTGLTRLIEEDTKGLSFYRCGTFLNHNGRTAQEVLRVDGNRINRLRQMNGGRIVLSWLQYEQTMGMKIQTATIRQYERHGYTKESVWELLAFVRSPARLINYLEKQSGKAGKSTGWAISEYRDYLDMAKKQGLDLENSLFLMPKDLVKAHDDCVLYEKAHEIELKADGIRARFPGVEPVLEEIADKYGYTDERFCIVVPRKIEDIIREGRILGHCIDTTDRYFDRIEQHISYLVFLRRMEDPDKPWYTLEIEPGGTVRQQRTTGNNQNKKDAEQYMPFIREWQKAVRQRITAADRELAEKSKKTRLSEYRELREKKETVWHGALAGKLLADVLEADLIEEVG